MHAKRVQMCYENTQSWCTSTAGAMHASITRILKANTNLSYSVNDLLCSKKKVNDLLENIYH